MFAASKTDSVSDVSDDKFNYVTLLLHGDGTNGAQNNTFVDSSTNNFTITRNGNTTQGSFSPYGSNWSNYFDGSAQLSFSTNSGYAFGTGDFTVECWYYATSNPGYRTLIETRASNGTSAGWTLAADSGGAMYVYSAGFIVTGITIVLNTWNHVAYTRSGGTHRFFLNGTLVSSSSTARTYSDTNLGVGGVSYTTGEYWTGYLSNVRLIKGTCLYTTTFIPSTTPLTAVSGTTMLTCQSNRFIDNSTTNATITAGTGVSVQRFNPFGTSTAYSTSVIGGSGYFDGSDYLAISNGGGSALDMGTGNCTIEMWAYPDTQSTSFPSMFAPKNGWSSGTFYIRYQGSKFGIFWNGVGDPFFESASTYPPNAWYHVAVVRSGTTFTMYVNGVSAGTGTSSASLNLAIGNEVWLGNNTSASCYYKGLLSDVRVVKGTAVYTSTFTPPTARLTAISGTSLLTNMTNGAIVDNAIMNDFETVGNAQISTSVKKFGTGSLYFDGTGDWLTSYATHIKEFGQGAFTIECWAYITDNSTRKYIISAGIDTATHYNFGLELGGNGKVQMWASSNGSSWNLVTSDSSEGQGSDTIPLNQWNHIAMVRESNGTFKSYLNGVLQCTVSGKTAAIISQPTLPLNVGRSAYQGSFGNFNGYIDDLRITKGFARYTSNFTAPITAFSDKGPY